MMGSEKGNHIINGKLGEALNTGDAGQTGGSDTEGKSASGRAIPRRYEGAFYAFPSTKETGMSSREFEDRAMAEAGVALLPGAAFGEFGEGYVRLSYAHSQENISKALERLDRFVRSAA